MGKNDEKTPFYEKVALLCAESGISMNALSQKILELSNATATHWGKGKTPKAATIQRIAKHFGVTPKYLRDDDIPIGAEHPRVEDAVAAETTVDVHAADLSTSLLIIREQQANLREINIWLREAFSKEQDNTKAAINEMEAQRVSFDKKWADLPMFADYGEAKASTESKKSHSLRHNALVA